MVHPEGIAARGRDAMGCGERKRSTQRRIARREGVELAGREA